MRKKILIVDDNVELLELLCMAVKDAGFAVASATDGLSALAKARSLQPDLLVLDLVLPEMDGFAVCEAVRRERAIMNVPIIMLTGLTGEFTRYAGLESGASEYVKKPVSPDTLVSKIRFWLGLEQPARESVSGTPTEKRGASSRKRGSVPSQEQTTRSQKTFS